MEARMIGRESRAAMLRREMRRTGATTDELGRRIGYSPETIRGWLCRPGSVRRKDIPDRAWLLIQSVLMGMADTTIKQRPGRPI